MMIFKPRPNQEQVLAYRNGWMGVSAVPGSGKTTTLSLLAADLISGGHIQEGQEVLIVTLVNSSVDNFTSRVGQFIQARGLLPNVGYRVRTLHGLAHDIVRERPDLAGVSEGFEIADELSAERVLRAASDRWANENLDVMEEFLKADLSENDRQKIRRRDWPNLVRSISDAFIQQCKDYRLAPADIREALMSSSRELPMLEMSCSIYEEYEKALNIRGLLDFNDLIVRALKAIETDDLFLRNLRKRWPFILEDEAQDSSRLQEIILRTLVGSNGNWVRVGDPNQAIFETFTTASPEFLRSFMEEPGVAAKTLPNSGRSTASIIEIANHLITWTESNHPVPALRGALRRPLIQPAPEGDPQPNPPDKPEEIHLVQTAYRAQEEIDDVVRSAHHWIGENPEATVAVLVPRNERGAQLVEGLKASGVPYVELLKSTEVTRNIARALSDALRHLSAPNLPGSLSEAFQAWQWGQQVEDSSKPTFDRVQEALLSCKHTEAFTWPAPGNDWIEDLGAESQAELRDELVEFRAVLQRWHSAVVLPIDQLLLTIAQDLRLRPEEFALVYKLALALERIQRGNPSWQMLDLADELERIAKNQRRFIGFSDLESAFDPERYPGRVIVATMHKAKGLEWDRVYLLAVNQYNFPSLDNQDQFISEKWFLRDNLNLQAETLAQLRTILGDGQVGAIELGEATAQARSEYAAERLRLLYVGITRAKQELVITWNLGRNEDLEAAKPLKMLFDYWESRDA